MKLAYALLFLIFLLCVLTVSIGMTRLALSPILLWIQKIVRNTECKTHPVEKSFIEEAVVAPANADDGEKGDED